MLHLSSKLDNYIINRKKAKALSRKIQKWISGSGHQHEEYQHLSRSGINLIS